MFYCFTKGILKLLLTCNCYNKVVQYAHFNIFNFKMFCKGYQLYSLFISITLISLYRLKLFRM